MLARPPAMHMHAHCWPLRALVWPGYPTAHNSTLILSLQHGNHPCNCQHARQGHSAQARPTSQRLH